jgi:hypothetical protein
MLVQWPGSVSSLLSVSLFKFITWDRAQLVRLNIPLRFIFKPSYSGHCTSTNVMHNAAGQSEQPALAHLLAALSTATPKQAKEPTFPSRDLSKSKRLTFSKLSDFKTLTGDKIQSQKPTIF